MADSDYLKYLQNPAGTNDPYATNPFAEGAATDATGLTPFAGEDVAPFRFTQNALNPTTQATGGFAGRTQVARSPFTSGQEYQSLRGIRSQLEQMGNVQDPGAAPVMPQELNIQQPIAPVPAQETRQIAPIQAQTQEAEPKGLPTLSYDLPSNIVLGGMNPIYAAQKFAAYKDKLSPEELQALGPMTQVSGYDVKGMLGEEEYNNWFNKDYQGRENLATKAFFKNLSLLPSNVDPGFGMTRNEQNLASRDFTYDPYTGGTREDFKAGVFQLGNTARAQAMADSLGFDLSTGEDFFKPLGDTGLMYNPAGGPGTAGSMDMNEFTRQAQETLTREQHNGTALSRGFNAAFPGVVLGLMSYGLGASVAPMLGAAGAATGAGAAAGETAATGLAGMASMTAGAGATAVNAGATMAGTYGAQQLATQLGVQMDSPLVQMLLPIVMGGASGLASGGFAGATGTNEEQFIRAAEQLQLTDEQFAQQILSGPNGQYNSIAEYVAQQPEMMQNAIQNGEILSNTSNMGTTAVSPEQFQLGAGGIGPQSSINKDMMNNIVKRAVQIGAAPGANANAVGLSPYDQQMAEYNNLMSQYQSEVGQYNTDYGAYQTAAAEWQRKQELAQMYEQKMAEYEAKVGLYSNAQGLRGKQANMMSNIQGNLAENPFYDTPENYTGIQTMFV